MARNKALENAQQLALYNRDIAQSEDSKTALAKSAVNVPGLQAQTTAKQAEGDEIIDEDIGTAGVTEGLMTGIVASLVTGPFLGVLVGGAQFLLGRNAKKSIIDTFVADNKLIQGGGDIRKDQLNGFRKTATGPRDLQQLDNAEGALEIATNYALSANPKTKAKGDQMLTAWDQWIVNFGATQDEQQIVEDARVKTEKRQLGLDQYNKIQDKHARFDPKADLYKEIVTRANQATEALSANNKNFSHVDGKHAVLNWIKVNDIGSIVSGKELSDNLNQGNIPQQIEAWLNDWLEGKPILPKQRNEILRAIARSTAIFTEAIQADSTAMQLEIDAANLPEFYKRQFLINPRIISPEFVIEHAPPTDAGPAEIDAVSNLLKEAKDKITQQATAGLETIQTDLQRGLDTAGGVVETAGDFIKSGFDKFTRDVERGIPNNRSVNN